jgi:hypothetical protein
LTEKSAKRVSTSNENGANEGKNCLISDSYHSADAKSEHIDESVNLAHRILSGLSTAFREFLEDNLGSVRLTFTFFHQYRGRQRVACECWAQVHEWPGHCLETKVNQLRTTKNTIRHTYDSPKFFGKLLEGLEVENESASKSTEVDNDGNGLYMEDEEKTMYLQIADRVDPADSEPCSPSKSGPRCGGLSRRLRCSTKQTP